MAKKDRLTDVSVKIGSALGKADKQARMRAKQVSEASVIAKEELQEIAKQVEALKKQLAKTTVRLKKALSA
ncbi:MAG TPA: hypothetical protein VKB21_07275 [Candidatus Acidoferrum sp.]|nr:hypothetical protein [Candidatus Acidoferrum sp.]